MLPLGARGPAFHSRSSPVETASDSGAPRRRLPACLAACKQIAHGVVRCIKTHLRIPARSHVSAVLQLTRWALTGYQLHPAIVFNVQQGLRPPQGQFSHLPKPLRTADTHSVPSAFTVKTHRSKRKLHMITQYATHRRCPANAHAYNSKSLRGAHGYIHAR